jgi:hypothetical protein
MRRLLPWSFAGLVVILAGCADGSIARIPVEGTITCDGKPLETGTVTFRPDASKGNTAPEAYGTIDEDGRYALYTRVGGGIQPGAAPGWYKVGVVSVREPKANAPRVGAMPPPATPLIPLQYADPASSRLSVEVRSDAAPGAYDIKLLQKNKVARR